ncbi:MAG: hypothetical protein IPH04_19710 [Saprospirales bacterium]|nr:hypothetical protein [Saprospirales bacterium]
MDEALQEAVREMTGNFPSARLTETDPDLLIGEGEKRRLELWLPDSTVLFSESYSSHKIKILLGGLQEAISNLLQAQFLRGLELETDVYRVGFTLEAPNGAPEIRMNKDLSVLTINNQGLKRVYYTLIDIDARDKVSILLPSEGWNPADLALEPRQSRAHRLSFDTPGKEVLKLIVTPGPIDLREALLARQRGWRPEGFIEDLFRDSPSCR